MLYTSGLYWPELKGVHLQAIIHYTYEFCNGKCVKTVNVYHSVVNVIISWENICPELIRNEVL